MSNEINPTFELFTTMYYGLGIWREEEESEHCWKRWKLFHAITIGIFFILLVSFALMSYIEYDSLFVAQVAIAVIGLYVDLFYLLCEKDNILAYLEDSVIDSSSLNSEEKERVGKKLNVFMKLANAYVVMVAVTFIFVVVSPLPIFTVEKQLPLYINFSFAWKYNEIVYWIAYILLAWGIFLCAICSSIMIIIWYILFKFSLQYKILGNNVRNLGETKNQKKGTQNVFLQDFIGSVKTHRNLFETIERFRSCFQIFFMTHMIISGIYICFSTYVLAFSSFNNLIETTTNATTFIYGILNSFLVLYFANEIKVNSDRLSYCLFESNWIDKSQSYKKCLIILCEVLKQPQELVICKLYPMNLETFTSIMNSAYSMFNILKSFK